MPINDEPVITVMNHYFFMHCPKHYISKWHPKLNTLSGTKIGKTFSARVTQFSGNYWISEWGFMVVFLQAVTVLKSAIQVAPKQEKILKGTLALWVFL